MSPTAKPPAAARPAGPHRRPTSGRRRARRRDRRARTGAAMVAPHSRAARATARAPARHDGRRRRGVGRHRGAPRRASSPDTPCAARSGSAGRTRRSSRSRRTAAAWKLSKGASPLKGVKTDAAPGGRVRAHAFPLDRDRRAAAVGVHRARSGSSPAYSRSEARRIGRTRPAHADDPGGVGLVLGAGNVTSIPVSTCSTNSSRSTAS